MSEISIIYSHVSDLCIQSIPKRIGAYVVTHTPDRIHAERYVGSTKNLYNRMYGHYNKEIVYIDLYITDDIDLAESLERILMELVEPATNRRISPLSDKDKEIMDELLRDTNIIEYTSNNMVKIGCRFLKYVTRNKSLMKKQWRSISIDKEVYKLLKNKQDELIKENNDDYVELAYVTEMAITEGVTKVKLNRKEE